MNKILIVALLVNIGVLAVLVGMFMRIDKLLAEHRVTGGHKTDETDGREDESWHSWRFWMKDDEDISGREEGTVPQVEGAGQPENDEDAGRDEDAGMEPAGGGKGRPVIDGQSGPTGGPAGEDCRLRMGCLERKKQAGDG